MPDTPHAPRRCLALVLEPVKCLSRQRMIRVSGNHLLQLLDSLFRVTQPMAGQCAQQQRFNAISFAEVVVEEKQVRQRGCKVIDLRFDFHLSGGILRETQQNRTPGP